MDLYDIAIARKLSGGGGGGGGDATVTFVNGSDSSLREAFWYGDSIDTILNGGGEGVSVGAQSEETATMPVGYAIFSTMPIGLFEYDGSLEVATSGQFSYFKVNGNGSITYSGSN